MTRPEGLTDAQWNEVVEAKCRASEKASHLDRIRREGFEIPSYDPELNERCEWATHKKVKNRWVTAPCGKTATVCLKFAGPKNPEGVRTALCKGCLATMIRGMVGHLEYSE